MVAAIVAVAVLMYVVILSVSKSLMCIFILCIVMFMCCSAFKDIPGKGQDTYEYNPCYDFTDGGCVNVAVSKNFNSLLGLKQFLNYWKVFQH